MMNLPSRCIGSTAWTIIKVGKERKGNFSSIESSSSTCFPAEQHVTFADSADCPQPPAPSRVTGLAAHVLAPTRDRTVSVLPTGPGCSSPAVQDASGQETRFCNHLSPQNLLSLVGTPGGASRALSCLLAHQGLWQAQPGSTRGTKATQPPKSGDVFARLWDDIGQVWAGAHSHKEKQPPRAGSDRGTIKLSQQLQAGQCLPRRTINAFGAAKDSLPASGLLQSPVSSHQEGALWFTVCTSSKLHWNYYFKNQKS